MKTPSNCPICRRPLLNTEMPAIVLSYWRKECLTHPSHRIIFTTKPGWDNEVNAVILHLPNGHCIRWSLSQEALTLSSDDFLFDDMSLPFFEPDFSDHKKLLRKIKTLILFS